MIISNQILDSVEFYYYLKFKLNLFLKEFIKHHRTIPSYNHNIYDLIDELRKIKSTDKPINKIQELTIKTFPALHRNNTNMTIEHYIIEIIRSYKLLKSQ